MTKVAGAGRLLTGCWTRAGVPNKRIQRMAYGVSNKEVARSTADAPHVRQNARGHDGGLACAAVSVAQRLPDFRWLPVQNGAQIVPGAVATALLAAWPDPPQPPRGWVACTDYQGRI